MYGNDGEMFFGLFFLVTIFLTDEDENDLRIEESEEEPNESHNVKSQGQFLIFHLFLMYVYKYHTNLRPT